jgi:hypothetical protein
MAHMRQSLELAETTQYQALGVQSSGMKKATEVAFFTEPR